MIPAGTANDFAGALGMSHDPLEAARQIAWGEEERIDCGCVNGLYFVNIFSFGVFTTTSQRTPDKRKHRIGKLAYLIEGVEGGVVDARRAAAGACRRAVLRSEFAHGADLQRRDGRRIPPGPPLQRAGRSVRGADARKAELSGLDLGDGPLPAGGNPRIVRRLRVRRLDIESTLNEPTDVDGQKGAEFPLHVECLKGSCASAASARTDSNIRRNRMQTKKTIQKQSGPDKISISRIKQEMKEVYYLSDDLVILALDPNSPSLGRPVSLDGFAAIVMMSGEATLSINLNEYLVRPNDVVVFTPKWLSTWSATRSRPRPT